MSFSDKPGPPENLASTGYDETSVSLKWEEPEDDGGSDITGYVIERKEVTRPSWNNAMTTEDEEYKVLNLTTGKDYLFRVAAVNAIAQGPFTEMPNPITAKSPFGKYKHI